MKKLALDIGDVWTGSALSDALGIIARPHQTVLTKDLIPFIQDMLRQEKINAVVVGYPKTMRGGESAQTKKTSEFVDQLKLQFPHVEWVLWDERLSSKRADNLKASKNSKDKQAAHSRAAAFILGSYLDFLASSKINAGSESDSEFE